MTPATSAEDNDHWYIITQKRGGESAIYDNGSSSMMRAGTDYTAASFNGKAVDENLIYLVRFEQAVDGVYRIQFANGNFVQTSLTTGDYTTAGTYKFYNINGTDSHFGWNLTTDYISYGSRVDNNSAGGTVAFWESGEVDYTGGNNDWYIYNVTLVDPTEANMTITSVGAGTFCAPFDVTIPEGVTAYKLTGVDGGNLTKEALENTIPANTPVVVCSETAVDQTFTGLAIEGTPQAGLLTGDLGDVTGVTVGNYLLQNGSEGLGWYRVDSEGLTIGKNRCYLTANSDARSFYAFSAPTAINSIAAQAQTKADGKYIVNGRLVVVKAGKAYNMNGQVVK